MDSITQAALGAAIGEAMIGRKLGNKGAVIGAIIATLPDLDVILIPFFSELQKISIHRGYSHSLLICFLLAFILTMLLKKMTWSKSITYQRLWLFSFLSLLTHVLLDAFTAYGTQLFLPFSDKRISFDSINVIDPVYTLPLIIGTGLSMFLSRQSNERRGLANKIGLIISSIYLLFTLVNKQRIQNVFHENLQAQGIEYTNMLTVPVKVGNLNWYGVAKDDKHLYIGNYSMLKKNKVEFHTFPINDQLLEGLDKELSDRLVWFAQGFYTVAEHDNKIRLYNMQCDMQGVRSFGKYKAPTAFYYEITPKDDGSYILDTGMHKSEDSESHN